MLDFVSEIISCVKDKDKKILSGDPQKLKKFMIRGNFQEILVQQALIGY